MWNLLNKLGLFASDYDPIPQQEPYKQANEESNIITGVVLNERNEKTGRTISLRASDIVSFDCHGGCGSSYAKCYLKEKNCVNWHCINCLNKTGYFRRIKKEGDKPKCLGCNNFLVVSE